MSRELGNLLNLIRSLISMRNFSLKTLKFFGTLALYTFYFVCYSENHKNHQTCFWHVQWSLSLLKMFTKAEK